MNANRLEKYNIEKINRADIHGADYNPRIISPEAEKRLRKELRDVGMVQPIVINKRTMNIVGGHQRVSAMDAILRKNNYDITAAVIDVDEREEVRINILLNNPSVQGEWDMFKLRDISETFELPPDDMGFSKQDSLVLFDMTETDPMQFDPKEEIAEQKKEEAREHAKNTRERQKTDMNKNIGHMDKMAPRHIVLYFDDGKDCVSMLNLLEQEETELELNGNMILSIIREWKHGKA